ncbi:MAG: Ig-like domain-containing protein, partial [bacterium]
MMIFFFKKFAALTFFSILLFQGFAPGSLWSQPNSVTPVNFKIAFIGDQGLGADPVAVLNLIKNEGSHVIVHPGDLDYASNPQAWDAQINSVFGPDFPYFATKGNHDGNFSRYQQVLAARMNLLGIPWDGDLGVKSSFIYKGIFFALMDPTPNNGHDLYVRDKLTFDTSIWRIISWHKNMKLMQVGGKSDATGWGIYEESRRKGGIIATAHEHSYARTHLLSSCEFQTVASTSDTLILTSDLPETLNEDEGKTFVFHSGLAGRSIRPQSLTGDWWASVYTRDQNANFGALFGTFNYNGNPKLAKFYFKDIDGVVADSFFVISAVQGNFFLATNTSGSGSIELSPAGGVYEDSTVVTLTAIPAPGWTFGGWSGDLSGLENPTTLLVDGNKNVTATFDPPQHTLNVTINGSGSVDLNPPGGVYDEATVVTLTANPNPGSTFLGWGGDLTGGANPDSIIMDLDKNVIATFIVNDPPVAVDDSYNVDEDNVLSQAAPGVLLNDSDPDNDVLSASLETGPSNGALSLNSDGSFTYTPGVDFFGTDQFIYVADDGKGGTATGTVTLTVNPVNDPPVALSDSYNVTVGSTLNVNAPGVLQNDSDADGDNLAAAILNNPLNGSLNLNADGSFSYTPDPNFIGIDTFTYAVSDGNNGSASAPVSIHVNPAEVTFEEIQSGGSSDVSAVS